MFAHFSNAFLATMRCVWLVECTDADGEVYYARSGLTMQGQEARDVDLLQYHQRYYLQFRDDFELD